MTSELLVKASDPTTKEYKYVETILKGYETPKLSNLTGTSPAELGRGCLGLR